MNTTAGQSRMVDYKSGTFSSITVSAHMFATAVNTAIQETDFKPEQVQVAVTLKRGGRSEPIMNDNLLVLGVAKALKNGLHWFKSGYDRVYPSANTMHYKQRTVTLFFGAPIRVDTGDELVIEISPASACMNGNIVNLSTSFIEFYANPDIGYEMGIPYTKSRIIQANVNSEEFSLGDNVTKIWLLNFDKANLSEAVISSVMLTSDKYDNSYTFNRLLSLQAASPEFDTAKRYGAVPPTESVFRLPNVYPQSFILFDGSITDSDLDDVRLSINLNGANVNQSQNVVVWQCYSATREQINESLERQQKHLVENMSKL